MAKEQEKYDEAAEKLFSSIDKVSYFFHLIPLDSEAHSEPCQKISKMGCFAKITKKPLNILTTHFILNVLQVPEYVSKTLIR